MYRVTVTTRVLNDKDTLRLSAPILIWLVLFIIIFGVMLTARDGMIYKDNMKLNVTYSEQDNEVYLDDMHDEGKYNHRKITFFATISGDDVGGFIKFCRENNVQVEIFPE